MIEVFELALQVDRDRQAAKRTADRGSAEKKNPYMTDFGRCPRSVYYSLRNVVPSNPPDTDSLANFLFGHASEQAFVDIVERVGIKVVREVRVELPHDLERPGSGGTSGRSDFLLYSEDLKCIVEMKTTKSWQLKHLPQDAHVRQLNGYLHAGKLGLLKQYGIEPEDCSTGVLFYIIKDATRGRGSFRAFDVSYDPGLIGADLESNRILALLSENPSPPHRPQGFLYKKFPCSYCEFRDICWGAP